MEFLSQIQYWHWLVFGLILIVLEIFVPSAIFLWPGVAALATGLMAFAVPAFTWTTLLLIWAVLSVTSAFSWQVYRKMSKTDLPTNTINRRGQQIVGRHFTLTKDIVNGVGELNVDDTRWKVVSHHDLTAGTKVKVLSVEGTSLRVEEYIS